MARMTSPSTPAQRVAYATVAEVFKLKAAQRDLLDRTDLYTEILDTAEHQMWNGCGQYLMDAGIIGIQQFLDASDRGFRA